MTIKIKKTLKTDFVVNNLLRKYCSDFNIFYSSSFYVEHIYLHITEQIGNVENDPVKSTDPQCICLVWGN